MGLPIRKSTRPPSFDYSTNGIYSITVCTYRHLCLFGRIEDGQMAFSDIGQIVEQEWTRLPEHYEGASLDAFVVMPNHLHGMIVLRFRPPDLVDVEAQTRCFSQPVPRSISSLIGNFKSGVTRRVKREIGWDGRLWQDRFHDHVIRDEIDYIHHRAYILENPVHWHEDSENRYG